MTIERLLDIDDLAQILGISRHAVHQMRYVGEAPPAVKIGRALKWRREDVEAWLAERVER